MLEESDIVDTVSHSQKLTLDKPIKNEKSFTIMADVSDRENVFILSGELTYRDGAVFEQAFEGGNVQNKEIILDLKNLDFIDSAGIGMLLLLQERFESLYIRDVQGEPKKFIEISKTIPADHFI